MNIHEMHTTFRTLGQQMGMQLGRAILPESIDVCLNDTIIELTRQELLSGVTNAIQDSVSTQASTMSVINAFRTLHRVARYRCENISVYANKKVQHKDVDNGYMIFNIPTIKTQILVSGDEYKINPMLFLGFSVEYGETKGIAKGCRIVSSDVIDMTLADYCSRPSKEHPIAVLSGIPNLSETDNKDELLNSQSNEQVEIYTDKNCNITYINIKYIKYPNIVKFDNYLANCVNCDLPEHLHFEIVEKAVAKFHASIGAGIANQST